MEQQAGAAQLCLNVNTSTFLPGGHKIQDVRVRTHTFVVPGFPHAAVPLTVPPEAMCRIFDSILATILVALHLEKKKKKAATLPLSIANILYKLYTSSFQTRCGWFHSLVSIVTLNMQLRGVLKIIILLSALW